MWAYTLLFECYFLWVKDNRVVFEFFVNSSPKFAQLYLSMSPTHNHLNIGLSPDQLSSKIILFRWCPKGNLTLSSMGKLAFDNLKEVFYKISLWIYYENLSNYCQYTWSWNKLKILICHGTNLLSTVSFMNILPLNAWFITVNGALRHARITFSYARSIVYVLYTFVQILRR